MPSASNVAAASPKTTGIVFFAASGTTLPTDSTTALASAFKDCGYVSEDGVSYDNSRESTDIREMGGKVVLSIQTTKTDTFKFTLIESLNENALKAVYGDSNVTTTSGAYSIVSNSDQPVVRVWAIDMLMTDGRSCRYVIPAGKVTAVDTITYNGSSAVGYSITLTCTPDSSGNNTYCYISAVPSP